ALRLAHRKQAFLERAREALGHPIEIIAGMEEARLIYSGVANTMPSEPGRRLVVDIGGGSTELIIGEGLTPLELESLQMGCVALSERFFRDGKISAKRLERARLAVRLELEPVQATFRRRGWDTCAGSSGTVRAIGEAIRLLDPQAPAITPAGLARAIEYCVDAGHTRELKLEPITEDRRPVFPGGLAILAEVFNVLDIKDMRMAEGAMREGLLYDMLGRYRREEERLLARLVGAHRRKLSLEGVEELVPPWDRSALYLIVLLRLAVLLHRGRSTTALPALDLSATPRSLEVRFPARWLKEHPLT